MERLVLLITLTIPSTFSSYLPCTAKCYYQDKTTKPCWDPYATTSYAYQSETDNCLCCPDETMCSASKTINTINSYSYGYQTATTPTPLSCLCITDAVCKESDKCATCDKDSGKCLAGIECQDGTCKPLAQDCPPENEGSGGYGMGVWSTPAGKEVTGVGHTLGVSIMGY